MDNFDLKKYLVENKVTTNSRMLNEQTDSWVMIAATVGGMQSEQAMINKVQDPYTGPATPEAMKKVASKYGASQLMVENPSVYLFEGEEGELVIFIKKARLEQSSSYQGTIDGDFVGDLHDELIELTEKKVTTNSRMLDENTPAKYTKIKKVTFSKGITGEDGETLTNNPDGSYTFEKGQEDMEGGITTAILKYSNGYGVSGQEYDWNNREYEEEGYTYFYDKEGNQVEDERSLM